MALELPYFPPSGSKYEWHPPVLRRRPWSARVPFSDLRRSLTMEVWRTDSGPLQGFVRFYDLQGVQHTRWTRNFPLSEALEAVKATEALAESLLDEQGLPPWAEEALRMGWLPCFHSK